MLRAGGLLVLFGCREEGVHSTHAHVPPALFDCGDHPTGELPLHLEEITLQPTRIAGGALCGIRLELDARDIPFEVLSILVRLLHTHLHLFDHRLVRQGSAQMVCLGDRYPERLGELCLLLVK